jgi:murein DD-endopeptidase MepM/ murein hydrolase activator NlpD
MAADLRTSGLSLRPTGPVAGAGAADADRSRVRELAQEFESLLILQMIKQMRETFLDEEHKEEGFGAETMTETIDVELSRVLARQGGLGLARSIERGIDGLASSSGAPPAAGPVAASTSPVDEPTARPSPSPAPGSAASRTERPTLDRDDPVPVALELPLDARVSSAYGFRADPFHGRQRFHAGLDFAAAYGRDVPAAGAGRVESAGYEGGYGLTVVVDHGQGVRTRYAHLSSVSVTPGQELARSTVVGRVGQSGRATGPHLHFEVALDGRKVDPATVAHRVPGGLKLPGGVVDSSGDGLPAGVPAVE